MVRVLRLGAASRDEVAKVGEEGEIVALLAGDESFEGYWRRPDADAKALRDGWYFTGDTGYVDADGDLFVTGRVDDMIITGGENVSPVEIESCLSLHAAVSEVAVVGLPDERWGKVVVAFVKRRAPVESEELDQFCLASGLAASSGRAVTSSSQRSRNRRSASCCAACWWRANTSRSATASSRRNMGPRREPALPCYPSTDLARNLHRRGGGPPSEGRANELELGAVHVGRGCALATVMAGQAAHAQNYPARPIQVIVPFAGGSASDVVTRIMLDRMAKSIGQPFIVDNRPGAGGNTGTPAAAKAAPDGYTLVMSRLGPLAANRTLFEILGYDPEKDFGRSRCSRSCRIVDRDQLQAAGRRR